MGIDNNKWEDLKQKFKDEIIYKTFQYEKYPDWYNIEINAGEYAWKPAIIYETYLNYKDKVLVWMDAGTFIKKIANLENIIKQECIHTVKTDGDIKKWTHQKTIELLKPDNIDLDNRNGSFIGLNLTIDWVMDFLIEFYNLSTNKEYIAPAGSSRDNHRQDQSLLTILYYKYKKIYNFKESHIQDTRNIFYTTHNDID